jgi:hypothetical protein
VNAGIDHEYVIRNPVYNIIGTGTQLNFDPKLLYEGIFIFMYYYI